jgi:hypothetical protein
VSDVFGYGLIDAEAVVRLAEKWKTVPAATFKLRRLDLSNSATTSANDDSTTTLAYPTSPDYSTTSLRCPAGWTWCQLSTNAN